MRATMVVSVTFTFTFLALTGLVLPAYAYEEIEVSDGGTIKGTVTYEGRVPMRKVIPTKDQEVCGDPREEPRIRVGENNGVQEAVVYLEGVEKGKKWGEPEEPPMLDNEECRFVPEIQVVRTGDLNIRNSDPVLHNTHGFYGRRTAFNVALPNQGQNITKTLRRPGEIRVECDEHGWMLAWVYVADSPYYTLTGEDGSFTIEDVPPGEYTLAAHQGHAGKFTKSVTVKSGEATAVDIEMKK